MNLEEIRPDAKQNWLGVAENDFDEVLPLLDKQFEAKASKAIFITFSMGVKTQRDEWGYDFSQGKLAEKMRFFVDSYERARKRKTDLATTDIKWDRELSKYRDRNIPKRFERPLSTACIKRIDMPDEKARKAGLPPKCVLKADKADGRIHRG